MPLRLLRPTLVGERMTVIGFGVTENTKQLPVRRRREGLVVETVGPNRFDENGGQAVRGTFMVGQGPCSGDSGGPAIAESTGAIAGVYSILGAESCTEENAANVFVQLAEYDELISQAFDAVGREPWYEGEAAPGDKTASSGCSFRRSDGTTSTGAVCAAMFALLMSRRRRVFEFLS
jgi:hypothetical protein